MIMGHVKDSLGINSPQVGGLEVACPPRQSKVSGTAVRKVGGGHPRATTAGDDRYIILQAKSGRRQSASVISQQLSTATG
ncbi:hypothetical protein TNCV_1299971 [Trichonephila clavipes]|nr:hypothetical protein TNCV_1299971 [Trichonephila clavipes]